MQDNKKLHVGVIGMGKMGLLHASIINIIPGAGVTTIYDKSSIMKRFVGKALNDILITDKLEEFASRKYDAVYVTTPIPSHFSIVKEIYSLGISKNIFVEKTLTSNSEQSTILCEEAKAAGSISMVGYMSRFGPTFQKARALLQEEAIGNPISFKAYAYASDFVNTKGKLLPDKGGATRDLGAHVIDLSLWFFGDLKVTAKPARSATSDFDNGSHFTVAGSSGLTGEFDISWAKEGYRLPEFGLTIIGSKGIFTVNADFTKIDDNNGKTTSWHRQDLNDHVPFLLAAPEYYRENAHFIKSILEGKNADPDFSTASKVDRLIEQADS